jgi:hypothetical protein
MVGNVGAGVGVWVDYLEESLTLARRSAKPVLVENAGSLWANLLRNLTFRAIESCTCGRGCPSVKTG